MADRDAPPKRPAPVVTDDNAVYWEGAASGRLLAQACGSCGALRHPPRPMCPHCRSLDIDVAELSGRGSLHSYAILHHPQHPAFEYPVFAALVDLDEGVRVVSDLAEVDAASVEIGMRLEVFFEPTQRDMAVPRFRPPREMA